MRGPLLLALIALSCSLPVEVPFGDEAGWELQRAVSGSFEPHEGERLETSPETAAFTEDFTIDLALGARLNEDFQIEVSPTDADSLAEGSYLHVIGGAEWFRFDSPSIRGSFVDTEELSERCSGECPTLLTLGLAYPDGSVSSGVTVPFQLHPETLPGRVLIRVLSNISINKLAAGPGQSLLVGGLSGEVRIIQTDAAPQGFAVHAARVTGLASIADDFVSVADDGTVRRTNVERGEIWSSMAFPRELGKRSLALTEERVLVALGERIGVYNAETGAQEDTLELGFPIRTMRVVGSALIVAGGRFTIGGGLALLSLENGAVQRALPIDDEVTALAAINDGQQAAIAFGRSRIQIRNTRDGSLVRELEQSPAGTVISLFSGEGRLFAVTTGGALVQWDLDSGALLQRRNYLSNIADVSVSTDGLSFASGNLIWQLQEMPR